ncbi:MAG: ATP-dependent helicase HrpB [Actinomycetota bacterium]
MSFRSTTDLPVEAHASEIVDAIGAGSLVLTAEPGAGKTSLVPLLAVEALDRAAAEGQRVVLLQPRRLAARAAAQRLMSLWVGQSNLGDAVGLTMRGERRVSAATRIEVVTEAILTARLQRDPELSGVGVVIFDEFHERNLHSDLGLAMTLESRAALRPDLAVVVMSATLDADPVVALIEATAEANARPVPTIAVPGRTFPVSTEHLARPDRRQWVDGMAAAVMRAVAETDGNVVAFAPGRREIDDAVRALQGRLAGAVDVLSLHGSSSPELRAEALTDPAPGRRRVTVASAVAETSVTLPGVTAVVDGGLARRAVFHPETGFGRLETDHVTRFSADQRRGRAGRLGPGRCYRLWSNEEHRHLREATEPEIRDGDPLPVAFELAAWGDADGTSLPLLTHPGLERLRAGRRLLTTLGLLDERGAMTDAGRLARSLGVHPRVGALLVTAHRRGTFDLGARVAAVLDDDRRPSSIDLAAELDGATPPADRVRRWRRALDADAGSERSRGRAAAGARNDPLGALLAAAWPDRVAQARPGDGDRRFLVANGREVTVPAGAGLSTEGGFLVVVDADGSARSARVRRAVTIDRATVVHELSHHVVDHPEVTWDDRRGAVVAERQRRLGAIVLHREPWPDPPGHAVAAAVQVGLQRRGLDVLPWNGAARDLRARLGWLHAEAPDTWPAVDDESLTERMSEWLDLSTCRRVEDLARLDVLAGLRTLLGWPRSAEVDALAPSTLTPPGGRPKPVRYGSGRPVWAVRLQHLMGLDEHPTVGPHRTPITIELLSPADRPTQTTTDLPGFWRGSYAAVRADLRGRYPKHRWPERPWEEGDG